MTFLNPLLLLALVAVIIPIIIHLLNFRRATKIEFSTLMFLKEVKEKQVHKIRLKELILLLIRVLIITFIVLSFSKPFIKSENYGDASKNKTAVVLFDNSFSMEVSQDGKELKDIAKDNLNYIKSNYNPTDNFYILNSNFYLTQSINDTNLFKTSYTPFNIPLLLDYVEELLQKTSENFFEIYILSDFQYNNFEVEGYQLKQNSLLKRANFYIIPLLKRQPSNIAIQSIENLSGISDLLTESKFRVKIKNYNNNEVTNKKLNVRYNDSLVLEKYLSLKPLEIQNIDFNFRPNKTDIFYISSELQNIDNSYNDMLKDDKYYYATNLPEKIRVFILSEREAYSEYIRLAIKSINAIQEKEIITYDFSNKVDKRLINYDVLIISGKTNFSVDEINSIADFHKNGGGIMFFPAINTDIENINSLLRDISSFTVDKLIDVYNKEEIKLKFSELKHYILDGIFKFKDNENNELYLKETPIISKYFKLNEKDGVNPIIKIGDKDCFLAESRDSYAPILFYSVSSDLLMSDFPLRDIFPVLIIKSVYYLSYKNYANNIISGKTGILYIKSDFNTIKDLQNNLVSNKAFNKGFISISATKDLETPNIYLLTDSTENKRQLFTVNVDTAESSTIYADEKLLESTFISYGIDKFDIIKKTESISDVISRNRNGVDLTNLFLYLAIAFILFEIIFVKIFFNK